MKFMRAILVAAVLVAAAGPVWAQSATVCPAGSTMRFRITGTAVVAYCDPPAPSTTDVPAAPTGYMLKIYDATSQVPRQTPLEFPAVAAQCGIPPAPPTASTVNASVIEWGDTASTVCHWDTGGVLTALPAGNYSATLTVLSLVGPSQESDRAAFSRASASTPPNQVPPPPVTGLRVVVP